MLLDIYLYLFYKISLTGYWSDRVLFWICFIATPIVVFVFWKKLVTKIYFWLLVAGLILSFVPMAMPFYAIVLSTTGSGRFNHFTLSNNIRIQTVGYGIMGAPRLQIVKDGMLLDQVLLETSDHLMLNDSVSLDTRDAINVKLINRTDTNITVKYFFKNDSIQAIHSLKH